LWLDSHHHSDLVSTWLQLPALAAADTPKKLQEAAEAAEVAAATASNVPEADDE
jgi:hypothetical protein